MHALTMVLSTLLVLLSPLFGDAVASRLSLAQSGDTVVFDFHHSIAVVHVLSAHRSTVQLRVVTATKDVSSREEGTSYLEWLRHGAHGAISDETITISLDRIGVVHGSDSQKAQWLISLLQLELTEVPESQRRRAGPPPMSGEIDLRPMFNPRIVVNGKREASASTAFTTKWPEDGSELDSRWLTLYFPVSPNAVRAFPYWIESPSSAYHVSVIDSSRGPNAPP